MKNLTEDAVKEVALELIDKNGFTTNLDIKKELRNQGYFATQTMVSNTMDDIYDTTPDLEFENTNGHREFSLASTKKTVKTTNPIKASYTDAVESPDVSDGDWEVSNKDKTVFMYFLPGWPEYTVRYAFTKAMGINFADTRAKKVKH